MPICDVLPALRTDATADSVQATARALAVACRLDPVTEAGLREVAAVGPAFRDEVDLRVALDVGDRWGALCPGLRGDSFFGSSEAAIRAGLWASCPAVQQLGSAPEWAAASGSWALIPPLSAALTGVWTDDERRRLLRLIAGIDVLPSP